ncbi:DNA invertase Pin-like site-specific DNA recombinase [Peribacillus frigoritolerans]|nr:DNA invertase Pin-like site-specific DNA recombinase [Peribacillus frigoritolerans]
MARVAKFDQKEQFIELRAKCVSYDEIAKQIEVSKATLIKWGERIRVRNQ